MRIDRNRHRLRFGVLSLAILAASTAAVSVAGDLGRCATVRVPRQVVLPDGSVHEPGDLRLCMKSHGPNSGTYEIAVNGRAIGQWPSRIGSSDSSDLKHSLAVFEWVDDRLALVGYARPAGDKMRTYVFHSYGPVPERVLALRDTLLAEEHREEFIVYATRSRTR
jgi:hypothetical protein